MGLQWPTRRLVGLGAAAFFVDAVRLLQGPVPASFDPATAGEDRPVDAIDPQILNRHGSLFLTRPTLAHYIASRSELLWRAKDLFDWVSRGELSVRIDSEYPLDKVGEAHGALESRRTTGKVLIRINVGGGE